MLLLQTEITLNVKWLKSFVLFCFVFLGVFNTWRYFPDKRRLGDNYPSLYLYVFVYGDWRNDDIVYLHYERNFRLTSMEYCGHYVINEPWFEFDFSILAKKKTPASLAIKDVRVSPQFHSRNLNKAEIKPQTLSTVLNSPDRKFVCLTSEL